MKNGIQEIVMTLACIVFTALALVKGFDPREKHEQGWGI